MRQHIKQTVFSPCVVRLLAQLVREKAGSRFFVFANNFKRKHPEQNTTTYFRKIYLAEIRLTKSTVIFLLTLICGKINDIINI